MAPNDRLSNSLWLYLSHVAIVYLLSIQLNLALPCWDYWEEQSAPVFHGWPIFLYPLYNVVTTFNIMIRLVGRKNSYGCKKIVVETFSTDWCVVIHKTVYLCKMIYWLRVFKRWYNKDNFSRISFSNQILLSGYTSRNWCLHEQIKIQLVLKFTCRVT